MKKALVGDKYVMVMEVVKVSCTEKPQVVWFHSRCIPDRNEDYSDFQCKSLKVKGDLTDGCSKCKYKPAIPA